MHDKKTEADFDAEYLLSRRPQATEGEIESFIEKVSLLVMANSMDDKSARGRVYDIFYGPGSGGNGRESCYGAGSLNKIF